MGEMILTDAPTRPALRYFGGKWILGKWIISQFPQHKSYVDVFGGAANILLQKDISPVEVYNDIDRGVVTFFQVLRGSAGRTDPRNPANPVGAL